MVAGLRGAAVTAKRGQPYTAAKDQRVGGKARIIPDGATDRGKAHFIAIILHTSNHARLDAARVQHASRQGFRIGGLGAKTQYISCGDRPGRNPHDVPNHATHTGICAAKGFNGGGMVMRLNLKRDFVLTIVFDDACIIHKGGEDPGCGDGLGD